MVCDAARSLSTEIRTSEDVVVSVVGRELYEKFFRGYTRKQWGLDPSELDKSVTSRVPTRTNRDDRYFTDEHQFMPKHGYTRMFERMLSHPNIHVMTQTDYRDVQNVVPHRRVIFTGPIDEYFDFRFGKLPYRSLRFEHVTLDTDWHQSVAVVNYPQTEDYTRVTEYKHLTGQEHAMTALTYEYPGAEGDPYYPVPKAENQELSTSNTSGSRWRRRMSGSSGGLRPTATTTWTRSSARLWRPFAGSTKHCRSRRIRDPLRRCRRLRRWRLDLSASGGMAAVPTSAQLARLTAPDAFFWATGIEDTFITAENPATGRTLDEYELTGHYGRWHEDLGLVAELGVKAARYGVPWHRLEPEKGRLGLQLRRQDTRQAPRARHRPHRRSRALRAAAVDRRSLSRSGLSAPRRGLCRAASQSASKAASSGTRP